MFSLFSGTRIFVTLWSPSCSSIRGSIPQARILEWGVMPSSKGSSQPRIKPASPAAPASQADCLPLSHWDMLVIDLFTLRCKIKFSICSEIRDWTYRFCFIVNRMLNFVHKQCWKTLQEEGVISLFSCSAFYFVALVAWLVRSMYVNTSGSTLFQLHTQSISILPLPSL